MSNADKIRNAVQSLSGRAKRITGRATGDQRLEDQGWADQTKADFKQRAEKLKDAFRRR
ncbi:CsbD-like protein [Mycolicibacterium chubuense NBB4]|uniref:CsbD-like protein n=1 Tax=Mycolicibacterium chubuense (strain NBB4) TaxID=710421 RepID=I4BE48_MYCCN|nr:CsbD family protein [Mycolicibacterium chubuense]AFM15555.1 CsbD-like protein [Mycolicibacterium chubuense NBB4]